MTKTKVDAVQACEISLASPETKEHARLLTSEEWAEQAPPFYYIKVEYDQWSELEYDVAIKYILKNCTGWLYYSNHRFIFEKEEDFVLFRLWAENKPMHDGQTLAV